MFVGNGDDFQNPPTEFHPDLISAVDSAEMSRAGSSPWRPPMLFTFTFDSENDGTRVYYRPFSQCAASVVTLRLRETYGGALRHPPILAIRH